MDVTTHPCPKRKTWLANTRTQFKIIAKNISSRENLHENLHGKRLMTCRYIPGFQWDEIIYASLISTVVI